jgi:CheY-like chemotaxis protein
VAVLMLERLGQRADVVANGAEAVRAVEQTPYDLVLMDVQMPEVDGLEATRRIRSVLPPDRQPRIVAMTADAGLEDRERCLAAGMDDHLGKPIRSEDLATALARTAGAGAPAAPEAVDRSVLDDLTGRLGEAAAGVRAQLIDTWQQETGARLADMERAAATGDVDALLRGAHATRGSSASLGAMRLAEACGDLERQLRNGSAGELPAAVDRLRAAFEQAEALFREGQPT